MNGSLPAYETTVDPGWIDYNGHMSEAFYVLVFGFATDQVMVRLGLDEGYRSGSGCSLYTVEAHVRYLDEVALGQSLSVTTTIAGAAAKKLHLAHEMHADGRLVATEELLALHVSSGAGRAVEFPEHVRPAIEQCRRAGEPAVPDWIGRAVSL